MKALADGLGTKSMNEPYLCSVSDAAKMLGVGRTKLYDMIAKGEILSMQIGTRRLVKVASIRALIERLTGGAA
ncbi:hypothetical protein Sj15T_23980 [Sphingobium sp. TA15]|uniref:Putative excisionase n=2 Tax=Sphingomonadaceae TaxID=41297 RepID=D4Z5W3_SPHIU|nr:putative excisionase [Sphingobium indicum UT26S]BDD67377.1 hypothetical protein Sj15T_23980 [Sphingobium sp. TA15]